MTYRLGYCCINLTLQKQGIMYSRDMIKRTFDTRGIVYASELAFKNVLDLIKVIQWNVDNNIHVFRLGSNIFPWASQYKLDDLPDYDTIIANLRIAGELARQSNQRISAHPDHFVKLGSSKPHVVDNSIHELELQAQIFDLMGFKADFNNPINIHVGMNRSQETTTRWLYGFCRLSNSVKQRLVVENDDKPNAYSAQQLFNDLHQTIDIPITFDYFHHKFHDSDLSMKDAFMLAYSTWPTIPLFHYSESKMLQENVKCNPRAHADYVFEPIDTFGHTVDIDLEAKSKELALQKYLTTHT